MGVGEEKGEMLGGKCSKKGPNCSLEKKGEGEGIKGDKGRDLPHPFDLEVVFFCPADGIAGVFSHLAENFFLSLG